MVDTMIKQNVTKMNSRKERDVSKNFWNHPFFWCGMRLLDSYYQANVHYCHFITLSKWTKYITCTNADLASGPSYDLSITKKVRHLLCACHLRHSKLGTSFYTPFSFATFIDFIISSKIKTNETHSIPRHYRGKTCSD